MRDAEHSGKATTGSASRDDAVTCARESLCASADIVEGDVGERFEELWDRNSGNHWIRDALLKPFLEEHQPSRGYKLLAELIAAGYFDVILNFNYDSLLNEALKAHPEVDVDHLIRGRDTDQEIKYSMKTIDPRVKHLNLHGSLNDNAPFFFSAREMNDYPQHFKAVVRHWTEKDIIVCGYAFRDDCVIKAFSSEGNREIFCVNPTLPPALRGLMTARIGSDYRKNVISGEMGRFDTFVEELYGRLEFPGGRPAKKAAIVEELSEQLETPRGRPAKKAAPKTKAGADIFISYARKDRQRAETLALALEAQGWSVWWDLVIPAGKTFPKVIEEQLDAAKCVVVLWSKESVGRRWVLIEAEEGAQRNVLVPIRVGRNVRIPLAFRQIQAADLIEWEGRESDPRFQKLVTDITAILRPSEGER